MQFKFQEKKYILLFLPIILWGIFTWYRQERLIQLISYPLSYLITFSIYSLESKVKKIYFYLFGLISTLFLVVFIFRNLSLNSLFYLKVFWLIFIPFQFSKKINIEDFSINKLFNILKLTRYFIYASWFLFLIQISIGSVARIADILNIYKFTGGWFDGNYFSSFCFLIYIILNELCNKILKNNFDKNFYFIKRYRDNTLRLLTINIILSFSVTTNCLLILYLLFNSRDKFYKLFLTTLVTFSLSSFIFLTGQSVSFINNNLIIPFDKFDNNTSSYNIFQIYYQYRITSFRMRLEKAQSIFYEDDTRFDDLATHNSLITIVKNIKFDKVVDFKIIFLGLLIYLAISLILINSLGTTIGLNFIIISMAMDPFFSGFSLIIPILITFHNINSQIGNSEALT